MLVQHRLEQQTEQQMVLTNWNILNPINSVGLNIDNLNIPVKRKRAFSVILFFVGWL